MYNIIRNVIQYGTFDLESMLSKINTLWVHADITDDQREQLIAEARAKANPKYSYRISEVGVEDLLKRLSNLEAEVDTLRALVNNLAELPVVEKPEYPEFVQPTGAHDAYNIGNKITYDGRRYICQMDGCVWDPVTYPEGWEMVD